MNTQVQKIKDEIKRRIRETDLKDVNEYRSLLTFINSLPEESAIKKLISIDYETEQEIKKVYERFENPLPEFLDYRSFAKIAHYFAEWQKEQAWDRATLEDWYINSIANDTPPVWTPEHIDELCKDFYLIKKEEE